MKKLEYAISAITPDETNDKLNDSDYQVFTELEQTSSGIVRPSNDLLFPTANLDSSFIDDPQNDQDESWNLMSDEADLTTALAKCDEKMNAIRGDDKIMKIGNR